jgi:hypothetical protein
VAAKSAEARKLVADLQRELEKAGARQGHKLVFSAAENACIQQVCSLVDRKTELWGMYEQARSVKSKLKLSQELRLVEQAVARLLRDIKTDVAPAPSLRSQKATRAARARWDRGSA